MYFLRNSNQNDEAKLVYPSESDFVNWTDILFVMEAPTNTNVGFIFSI